MKTPNIFDFATSELSQDAVLAYMLKWASPDYAETHRPQHDLGEDFLRTLLKETGGKVPDKFTEVDVQTQQNRVDVSVEVNGKTFLILEDKTNTDRHSNQIKTYVAAAKERGKAENAGWKDDVRPIYIKTGNESKHTREVTEGICKDLGGGHFYRNDLLKLLGKHTDTGDQIVDQFHHYLEDWQQKAESFRSTPVNEQWDWFAYEGYYAALENEEGFGGDGWGYVSNPSGGFQCFYGHFHEDKKNDCSLYLQIHDARDLFIRITKDGKEKVQKELRRHMTDKVEKCLSEFPGVRIERIAGRAGSSSNIAEIFFDEEKDESDTYMAKDTEGKIDFPATVERLKTTVQLIKAACK